MNLNSDSKINWLSKRNRIEKIGTINFEEPLSIFIQINAKQKNKSLNIYKNGKIKLKFQH